MDSAAATQANNIIDDILFDAPPQNNEPQTVNMNNIDHSTKVTKIMTAAKPKVCSSVLFTLFTSRNIRIDLAWSVALL